MSASADAHGRRGRAIHLWDDPCGASSNVRACRLHGQVHCPRISYTDLNGLRFWAEWHEVRQPSGGLAWDLAAVGSHHASPVWMRVNLLLVQEVIRWFRISLPSSIASPASGPCGYSLKPSSPCAVKAGLPAGARASSRRSPLCRSPCGGCGVAIPPVVICLIRRACASARRPPVTPGPASRNASLTASGGAAAARCSDLPWLKGGGMGLAHHWSMAREAPRPSPPP